MAAKNAFEQEQELNQRLELHFVPPERLVAADHEQDRQEQLAVELEQGLEYRGLARGSMFTLE